MELSEKVENIRKIGAKLQGMAYLLENVGYDDCPPNDNVETFWGIGMILGDIKAAINCELDEIDGKFVFASESSENEAEGSES